MKDLRIYQELEDFSEFEQLTNDQRFIDVPDDWIVIITDVKGSTKAIQEGRYKQVNMIGAASITCVLNELGTSLFPFVFGGDGSTIVIPKSLLDRVLVPLNQLQRISVNEFQLDLRVGYVPVSTLYKQNASLRMGRYSLSPGTSLAQFFGTGLTLAEDLIKSGHPDAHLIKPDESLDSPNLNGLSCRLEPFASSNGQIISLLVQPRNSETLPPQKILSEVLQMLYTVTGNEFVHSKPILLSKVSWSWIPKTFKIEVKLNKSKRFKPLHFLYNVLSILIVNLFIHLDRILGSPLTKNYQREMVRNSDFKKFDETLRMVIDCSNEQLNQIESELKRLHQNGYIYYGIHQSNEAIMTCMLYTSESKEGHIHFIDGGGGGYAMAALQLKQQISHSKI